jgi:hypothetical protein
MSETSSVIRRTLFALFAVGVSLSSPGIDFPSPVADHSTSASLTTVDEPGAEPSTEAGPKETPAPALNAEEGAPAFGGTVALPLSERARPRSRRPGVRFGRAPPLVLSPA